MSNGHASRGLASRIVRLTFIMGALTVLMATVVAVYSTSRLTAEQFRARDLAISQRVEDGIEFRLRSLAMAIDQAGQQASVASTQTGSAMAAAYGANREYVSSIILADARGRVLSVLPENHLRSTVRAEPAFQAALSGGQGYISVTPRGDRPWELWLTKTVIGVGGEPLILLAEVDPGFLASVVRHAASQAKGSTVLLVDGERRIVASGDAADVQLGGLEWMPDGTASGSVRLASTDRGEMVGRYDEVAGVGGVKWRTVVLQPTSLLVTETVRTVTPSMLVLLFGGMAAMVVAWGVGRRVARPLRDLENAAKNAAAGSYVRPIVATGDDEVGRVADAFNAVALRLNSIHDLSQLLASASRLDQVLDGILAAVGHLVGPGSSVVYLYRHDPPAFMPVRTRGRELARVSEVPAGRGGWLDHVLAGTDIVDFAGSRDELALELPGAMTGGLEVLGVPLIVGNEQLGVVVVARGDEDPLGEAEREMLRTFTAQASVAVHTSRLFQHEQEARRTAEALRTIAEQLVRPRSLALALGSIEGTIAALLDSPYAAVTPFNPAALGLPPDTHADVGDLRAMALRALGSAPGRQATVMDRGEDDAADVFMERENAASVLVAPIGVETDHGAVLVVALPDGFSRSRAMGIGAAVAGEIALALDNAYFYQRALARAANLETMFTISQAVASSLQVNVVLNRVLDVVQKILSADGVVLMSYDTRTRLLTTSMARGSVPGELVETAFEVGEDIPGAAFGSGEPVAVRDLHEGMQGVPGFSAREGLHSLIAVPLLARGRSIGVLMVTSVHAGAFSEEDVNVLRTFATQAALAIDTARLYSREHEVSHVLQQAILPEELPAFDEIEAGSVYAPAGNDSEIGGDYYDLFRGVDGDIWFAIGDVCGKGVYAATKTTMIKYVVRALALAGWAPAAVLSEANDMIATAGDPSDIVTLWVGRFDPVTGMLTWADGGHPPGLLRRRDGTIESMEVTGALLGAMLGAPYEDRTTSFARGDMLMLYTDGVTEARRGNIFYGEGRVREVLAEATSAQEASSVLLSAVNEYVGGDLRDDVAVLVVAPR